MGDTESDRDQWKLTLFKPKWYLLDEMFIYTIQLKITLHKGLTEIIFSLTKYMY